MDPTSQKKKNRKKDCMREKNYFDKLKLIIRDWVGVVFS